MKCEDTSRYGSLCDEELVRLANSGDGDAFNYLASKFLKRPKKLSSAGYLDGDDLTQEGMFGFMSAVRTYEPGKGVPFSAYALVCMNNSITSAARKSANDIPISDGAVPDEVPGVQSNPLDSIVECENYSSVLSVCEKVLTDAEKSVIFCRMSGLSYSETAEKLGISQKNVDNAIQRARRKLKQVFA